MGGQDGHLDFHTQLLSSGSMLLDVHRDRRDYQGRAKEPKTTTELRGCVNREVGLGSHSLSHSSPVPNKPCGFCGRKAP